MSGTQLDFPNTPAVGQTFAAAGSMWQWDGVKWQPSGAWNASTLPNPTITLENIADQYYPIVGYIAARGTTTTTDVLETAGFEQTEPGGGVRQISPFAVTPIAAGQFNHHIPIPYKPNTNIRYCAVVRARENPADYVQGNWFCIITPGNVPA